ncbi:hypothetical protein [Aeromicrobium sp.]|uniref:hypothetical protein n=1 Tax=Aeromicrobium sp. TaxID=1871063 RepID=UPI0019C6520F|nr:hypothetical protein [Aeromicrobium sp.]MBC7631803.1 hypothetical protein [Aeromicrobium sp.]
MRNVGRRLVVISCPALLASDAAPTDQSPGNQPGCLPGGFAPECANEAKQEERFVSEHVARWAREQAHHLGSSASATKGAASAPIEFGGVNGGQSTSLSSTSDDTSSFRDGERSGWSSSSTSNDGTNDLGFGGGGFDPAFAFGNESSGDRSNESLSANNADDVTSKDSSSTVGSYGYPFSYEGAKLVGNLRSSGDRTSVREVSDDGSNTLTETSTDAQRTQPVFGLDGLNGHPADSFTSGSCSSSDEDRF